MARTGGVVVSTAMTLLCWTGIAAADPITATYSVQVTQRTTPASSFLPLPFTADPFTLQMTFDPALGGPFDTGVTYGPVAFSSVPLPSVAPPAGLPLTTQSISFHGRFEESSREMTDLSAGAGQTESHLGSEFDYFRTTSLGGFVFIGDAPIPFTPENFPAHLVLASPFNFSFSTSLYSLRPTLQLVDSVEYRGFATLVGVSPASPTPEPATLTLVGGALALLAQRRRRQRAS